MRAIVVYESLWGNTEKVARAIETELLTTMSVDIVDSRSAPQSVDGYDLVIVGGPTHAFSMSRPATREAASGQNSSPRIPERGIREWLSTLQPPTLAVRAATFDTRVESPRLPGSAAKVARHELRALGFDVLEAESYRVHGYSGPLVDGEIDRAVDWAHSLAVSMREHRTVEAVRR